MKELRRKSIVPIKRSKRRRPAASRKKWSGRQAFKRYLAQAQAEAETQTQTRIQTLSDSWLEHGIYDLAPIGFLTLDRRGRIIQLNQKTADLLGIPLSRLLHRPFLLFVAKQ